MNETFEWFLRLTKAQREHHIKVARMLTNNGICSSMVESIELIHLKYTSGCINTPIRQRYTVAK